jgi:hypothetical protein
MITKAIKKNVGDSARDVVGYITITKYIENNYNVGENFKRFVKMALNKAVEEKALVQVRNSFRLSSKSKKRTTRSASPATRSSKKVPKN